MKAKNTSSIRKARAKFVLIFFITLAIVFGCGFATVRTAQEGILILEKRYAEYIEVFEAQAVYNFKIDKIISYINKIRQSRQVGNEHKERQGLITDARKEIEFELEADSLKRKDYFIIYEKILKEIQEIQLHLDENEEKREKLDQVKEELEKCKEKYLIDQIELNRNRMRQ